MDCYIIKFLRKCKIQIEDEGSLDGLFIPREILLSEMVYDSIKDDIIELRGKYSSTGLTSLQKTAAKDQKWPLLNLVRQMLRTQGYIMKPVRKAAGYTKGGVKIYKRFFSIAKMLVPIKPLEG